MTALCRILPKSLDLTEKISNRKNAIMNKLRKNSIGGENNFEPKEGQREFLRSSKDSLRCPSFGINNNSSEDASLDYLAKILVEAFLDKKEHEYNQPSK